MPQVFVVLLVHFFRPVLPPGSCRPVKSALPSSWTRLQKINLSGDCTCFHGLRIETLPLNSLTVTLQHLADWSTRIILIPQDNPTLMHLFLHLCITLQSAQNPGTTTTEAERG